MGENIKGETAGEEVAEEMYSGFCKALNETRTVFCEYIEKGTAARPSKTAKTTARSLFHRLKSFLPKDNS